MVNLTQTYRVYLMYVFVTITIHCLLVQGYVSEETLYTPQVHSAEDMAETNICINGAYLSESACLPIGYQSASVPSQGLVNGLTVLVNFTCLLYTSDAADE